jgi:hypothetical protein
MMLGTTTLPNATMGPTSATIKQAVHAYDWSDRTDVTYMGKGQSTFPVTGVATTEADLIAVIGACEAAQSTAANLYFPVAQGGSDDRYYTVQTGPCVHEPLQGIIAGKWTYEFNCITTPYPYIYDAATGARVT